MSGSSLKPFEWDCVNVRFSRFGLFTRYCELDPSRADLDPGAEVGRRQRSQVRRNGHCPPFKGHVVRGRRVCYIRREVVGRDAHISVSGRRIGRVQKVPVHVRAGGRRVVHLISGGDDRVERSTGRDARIRGRGRRVGRHRKEDRYRRKDSQKQEYSLHLISSIGFNI